MKFDNEKVEELAHSKKRLVYYNYVDNAFRSVFSSSIRASVLIAVLEKCVLLAEKPLDCNALSNDEIGVGGSFKLLQSAWCS